MLALSPRECKRPHPGGRGVRTPVVTTRRETARQALGLASVGAGVIHLALGPEHMAHWEPLGLGFYATGVLQLLLGASLLHRESRLVLRVAALSSLLFLGVWLLSRTAGLPLGPEAWQAESTGRADLLCASLETVVALGALTLLRRPAAGLVPAGPVALRSALGGASLLVLATTGAAVAAPGHSHGVPEDCPTSIVTWGVDANHNKVDDGVERYFACELKRAHEGHVGYQP